MAYKIQLPTHSDPRGKLTVIDKILPFEVKRAFMIYEVTAERGGHRHLQCTQALIAVAGEVSVFCDNGIEKSTYELKSPGEALIVTPEDWHTMKFSPGSILLSLASHHYEKSDYIHEGYS